MSHFISMVFHSFRGLRQGNYKAFPGTLYNSEPRNEAFNEFKRSHDSLVNESREFHAFLSRVDGLLDHVVKAIEKCENTSSGNFVTSINEIGSKCKSVRGSFRRLMWTSRSLAGQLDLGIQDMSNVLLGNILSNDHTPLDDLMVATQDYLKELESDEVKTSELSRQLSDFQRDAYSLREDWASFVKQYPVFSDNMPCKELSNEITSLSNSLHEHESHISFSSIAQETFCFSKHAIGVINRFCPVSGGPIVIAIFDSSGDESSKKLCNIKNELGISLDKKRRERDNMLASLQGLQSLDMLLKCFDDICNVVKERLVTMMAVWSAMQADLTEIHNFLAQSSEARREVVKVAFSKQTKECKVVYDTLRDMLRGFQRPVVLGAGKKDTF